MEGWRQLYGEEEVRVSVNRLKRHIAKCWQPSWSELAGVLLPARLHDISGSNPAHSHVEESLDSGNDSSVTDFMVTSQIAARGTDILIPDTSFSPQCPLPSNVSFLKTNMSTHYLTADTHPLPCIEPQQKVRQHPAPDASATAMSSSRVSTDTGSFVMLSTSAPTVEDADRPQYPVASQAEGGPPVVQLVCPSKPRCQARDKATARIKECHVQKKKRPRSLPRSLSPMVQRSKTPAKTFKGHQQTNVEGKDATEVEHPFQFHNEAILPIKSTSIPYLQWHLTTLICI